MNIQTLSYRSEERRVGKGGSIEGTRPPQRKGERKRERD